MARRDRLALALLALLLVLPLILGALGEGFMLGVATRILAFAIAALALDLVLGYGAMVSFGHAAYLGIGAYVTAILARTGVTEIMVQMLAAMAGAALFAAVTGAIGMRTRGIYFIMITLAFSQMAFFFFVSFSALGGDDGTQLAAGSSLLGTRALASTTGLYLFTVTLLAVLYVLARRLTDSRFGRMLMGTRENMVRMRAIGVSPFPFRLTAYVISAAVTSLAGVIMANQAGFVSPALMNWHRSGELIVFVVLGGPGTLVGPIIGAIAAMSFEEGLAALTQHWRLGFGLVLIAAALRPKGWWR
ncbi:branched-chain amino acid ABC transporter permease [Paracoccus suum]|nr:branched-chain amino acid ABC transporter permease [Paracoccus suum]